MAIEGHLRSHGTGLSGRYVYMEIGGRTPVRFRTIADGYFSFLITPDQPGTLSGLVQFRGNANYRPSSSGFTVTATRPIPVTLRLLRKEVSPPANGQFLLRLFWRVDQSETGIPAAHAKLAQYLVDSKTGQAQFYASGTGGDDGVVLTTAGFAPADYGRTVLIRAEVGGEYYGVRTESVTLR